MKNKLFLFLVLSLVFGQIDAFAKAIKVKSVIVTFFQPERDAFLKNGNYSKEIDFPQGFTSLRYDEKKQSLLLCTGIGTARSAASVMALGMDSRFDLSQAVFFLAGISGGDPQDVSLGSVVFADYVVDADFKHSIDMRELPASEFKYGIIPFEKVKEFEMPVRKQGEQNEYYVMPQTMLQWAYNTSKDIKLSPETESLKKKQALYKTYPKTQEKPQIYIGSNLDGQEYWHGKIKTAWANDWVSYFTQGKGNFMTTAMEDSGALQALTFLSGAKKVNIEKVIVARSISNFCMQGDDNSPYAAYDSFSGRKEGATYSAFEDSLNNLAIVVMNLVNKI